jgi:hypothetical protein
MIESVRGEEKRMSEEEKRMICVCVNFFHVYMYVAMYV